MPADSWIFGPPVTAHACCFGAVSLSSALSPLVSSSLIVIVIIVICIVIAAALSPQQHKCCIVRRIVLARPPAPSRGRARRGREGAAFAPSAALYHERTSGTTLSCKE